VVAWISIAIPYAREKVLNVPKPHPPIRFCLAIAIFLAYGLAAAGQALADEGVPTLPLAAQQVAETGQEATANGAATQTEPVNIVVSIRVDSPGNDGAVSQSNVTVVGVAAGNNSGTRQSGADGGQGGQQAATGQDASVAGQGNQAQPRNVVVSIRVNSPGNNGPVSQANVAVVGVDAGNASLTSQGRPEGRTNSLKTAVPSPQGLRHSAAHAEAADVATAAHGRPSAPRRSARVPGPTRRDAAGSSGRPSSGAAAAHSAGFPAAAARASLSKTLPVRPATSGSTIPRPGVDKPGLSRPALPVSRGTDQPAGVSSLLTLTAVALLGALAVWASSSWLTPAWRRRQ
jgi:hypothetical protein